VLVSFDDNLAKMYQFCFIYLVLLQLARKSDSRAAGLMDVAEIGTQKAPSTIWQEQAAVITAPPSQHLVDLRNRQVGDSVCGYWSDGGDSELI
jgi:hypothetical protein